MWWFMYVKYNSMIWYDDVVDDDDDYYYDYDYDYDDDDDDDDDVICDVK